MEKVIVQKTKEKCIMITGCNRGIGKGLFDELEKDKSVSVIIAAIRRIEAMELMPTEKEEKTLRKIQLDLMSRESIEGCVKQLHSDKVKVDVLINNAAFMPKNNKVINEEIAQTCIQTNFIGTMMLTEALIDQGVMSPNSKVINVSSSLGKYDRLMGKKPKTEVLNGLLDPHREAQDLLKLAGVYLNDVKDNKTHVLGWPTSAYAVSKMLLNSYTEVLGRSCLPKGIQVYACCPGWVRTESTAHTTAARTVGEGIKGIMELFQKKELREEEQGRFYAEGRFQSLTKT